MNKKPPSHPVFILHIPENSLPLIFDSPHSGSHHPSDFGAACAPEELRRVEDSFVDELFDSVPAHGGVLLAAKVSRAYIDLNRAETDIDERLLSAPWPGPAAPTSRSENGIGLIHRIVRPGVPVYDRKLSPEEIRIRIETVWRPYHAALKTLIDDAHFRFGRVWHVNCHAMPAAAGGLSGGPARGAPDIVLGNRDGTSCSPDFLETVRNILKDMGYRVAVNDPYKGVELVRRYADPAAGRHSLQIEVSKALYLNERTLEKSKDFKAVKRDIDALCREIAACVSRAGQETLAAD